MSINHRTSSPVPPPRRPIERSPALPRLANLLPRGQYPVQPSTLLWVIFGGDGPGTSWKLSHLDSSSFAPWISRECRYLWGLGGPSRYEQSLAERVQCSVSERISRRPRGSRVDAMDLMDPSGSARRGALPRLTRPPPGSDPEMAIDGIASVHLRDRGHKYAPGLAAPPYFCCSPRTRASGLANVCGAARRHRLLARRGTPPPRSLPFVYPNIDPRPLWVGSTFPFPLCSLLGTLSQAPPPQSPASPRSHRTWRNSDPDW
ncbi:hypothetical protein B0H15DRAFT_951153 [Mycena belliarum]|uniref:Uncharacterized protein n=1 Tax=Mycena belliarum TaxID=1033014 RepID=A0AAD6U0Y0_9AGAR|nr:hypothetical protein B0H15DRAFT_951153 [Mycena belliae]